MSQDKEEQEFEAYLEGKSSLSADFQAASGEEPSAALDDSILAASRRELKTRPGYAFSPFASDWHVPASLAAVLVLSVSVFVSMQEDHESSYLKAPTAVMDDAVEESIQSQPEVENLFSAEEAAESPGELSGFAPAPSRMDSAGGEAGAMLEKVENNTGNKLPMKRAAGKQKRESVPEMLNIPAQINREIDSYAADSVSGRSMDSRLLKREPVTDRSEVKKKEVLDFPAAEEMVFERRMMEKPLLSRQRNEDTDTMPASAALMAEDGQPDPLAWLVQIQADWDEGKREQARRELRLFHQRYPEFELEAHLDRDLLQTLEGSSALE